MDTFNKDKITSYEKVTLRLGGSRSPVEFEIKPKDSGAEIALYHLLYRDGKDEREIQIRALCGKEEALSLLNDCEILSWDGFYGPHPPYVLDGTAFTFDAVVNDGKMIHAYGSENFPEHFRDFTGGINTLLDRNGEKFS